MTVSAESIRCPVGGGRTDADHIVQFYEHDDALIDAIAPYLREGLESGAGAILVCTAQRRQQLRQRWQREGFDLDARCEPGQLLELDAREALDRITVEGWPDEARFDRLIGTAVGDAERRFGRVIAFGEMVALLWAEQRRGAAVRLEGLWNALLERHAFSLYCAYPIDGVAAAGDAQALRHVCSAHSRVISPGPQVRLGDPAEQVRLIVELQQKTAALQREIEGRKRLEGMLAERERELSDFLDNAVVGLHRIGPDGTILWANRAELELVGYDEAEYVGRNIAEFHVDRRRIDALLERLSEGETLRDESAQIRRKDGTTRHVLISSNALIRDGRLLNTRCFTRDVTDRWQAQEALRERSAILHLAMQGARMGYLVGDVQGDTLRCSPELAELLGLEARSVECPIDEFLDLVHGEDRPAFDSAVRGAIRDQHEFFVEFRPARIGGPGRWLEARGQMVRDDDGRVVRFYGACVDVTLRKRETLARAHLAAIVESSDDAIVSKTLQGIVQSWNAAAERIFGYTADEMVGRPITTIIPEELRHEEAEILARILAGERLSHYETTRVAKDGTRKQVSLTVSPVRDDSGRIIGASKIARDISAQRRVGSELTRMREQLDDVLHHIAQAGGRAAPQ